MSANYSTFTALPNWTRAVWSGGTVVNKDDPFKWGGQSDPPAIGAKVTVYVNNLGAGTVLSYFAESGWLGVLVKFDDPPEWYRKQNGADKPGHVFGREIEPFKKAD